MDGSKPTRSRRLGGHVNRACAMRGLFCAHARDAALLYAHKPREAQGSHIQCLTSHLGAPSHVPAEKEFPRELDRELRK
ncbi:MAG: hypothetical protein QOI13_1064 [Paraburkholderia sp.]|nr:hypothetical protein [Paraburkholderia sp.]